MAWRPLRESNPCSRRERAVSWASRRRGRGCGPLSNGSAPGDQAETGRRPAPAAHRRRALFPEIDVLQRLLGLDRAELGDGGLEVVAFLARDAQLVALDRDLDLELAVLDLAHQALGELLVDALLEQHGLAHRVARGLFGWLELERGGIDLAPRQMRLQELMHLLQLEIVVGEHRHGALLALDRA